MHALITSFQLCLFFFFSSWHTGQSRRVGCFGFVFLASFLSLPAYFEKEFSSGQVGQTTRVESRPVETEEKNAVGHQLRKQKEGRR